MSEHARVVIVGGGILGCSLAYHLAREGWTEVVLLEKAELCSGSTWHAAGQVTHSTSSYVLGRMAGYAIELYRRIEAETGQAVSFHDCGSLRLAYTADEVDWLRYTMSVGAALGLQGPRSREVLERVTPAPLDNAAFRWRSARTIPVAGAEVRALRLSYAGELGFELHIPRSHALAAFDALWEAGKRCGMAHYGSFAMNAMRMEKMFKGASELGNEVTLPEAGAMRFVRMNKPGGFVGREATRRSLEAGERRWQCVYLEIDARDADCLGGEAVFDGNERVGAVSSGAWGPSVGASLAFAYIAPERATPGTELQVLVLNERRPARVLGAPKYDPDNRRPRG